MKKTLFTILAVAALAACAKEEVVTVNQDAIAFTNAFVDNTTKAIDPSITTTTLDGFTVYGTTKGNESGAPVVNIYPAVPVTGSVTTVDDDGNATAGSWSYDDQYTQYWIAGNTYNFAAVKNGEVDTDANGMPESIAYDAADQTDLLYAEAVNILGKTSGNEAVAFTFSHLLSKVKFSFQNTSAASTNHNYTYKVTDITISGVGLTASCDVTNFPTYVWGTPATSYSALDPLTFGHIVDKGVAANEAAVKVGSQVTKLSNYERLLIPGNYTAMNVKARVALLYGEAEDEDEDEVDVLNYDKTVTVDLKGGNAYNFVLTGSIGEPIEFTVTRVDEWVENPAQYTENPAQNN